MNVFKKLNLAFALIIVLFAGYGAYSIQEMKQIASTTDKIFKHPLAVSNAMRNLNAHMLEAELTMFSIARNNSSEHRVLLIRGIEKKKIAMIENYELVAERYLGPEDDINRSRAIFESFFLVADDIISAVLREDKEKARQLMISNLDVKRQDFQEANQKLIDFASGKANQFYYASSQTSNISNAFYALILALIFSILVTVYIVRSLGKVDKSTAKHLHLIDQNILTAQIGLDGKIQRISSALCRALNISAEKQIGKDSNFFIDTAEEFEDMRKQIFSGKGHNALVRKLVKDEPKWFDMHIEPEFDTDFKLHGFNAFFTDITSEKRIEEVSIKDGLTGLYNRNYFEMVFAKEMKKAKRDNKLFGVILLDIDYFKQFNDTYGHLQGDYALRSVASVLDKNTRRSYDLAFRVGGEEFLIMFSVEQSDNAGNYAEAIRREIESLNIEHSSSDVAKFLTVSMGIGIFGSDHIFSSDEIYNKTDEQLYLAKRNGRNRIECMEFS